ncbi:MAG: hypothetical protein RLZZ507_116 [Cyanobacteriota bacterium]|jgi:hypothetical protein
MISYFLEDLKSADLVGISLNPQNLGLRLDFTFGLEADYENQLAFDFYSSCFLDTKNLAFKLRIKMKILNKL